MSKSTADGTLTKEQFKKMSWDDVCKRAIPINDKVEFIRKSKSRKK